MNINPAETTALLKSLATELGAKLGELARKDPLIVGIHTGGVWVAGHLHQALGIVEPLGALNINFYRDDFSQSGLHPQVSASELPFAIDDRHIVLVDDVLHTGRTVRAALNEIFDYGRPASVLLVTLVDRGGRELPIQVDVVGRKLSLTPGQQIKLTGPEPLALEFQDC